VGVAKVGTPWPLFRLTWITRNNKGVPLASALVAHRDHYFGVLDAYRAGELQPLIGSFATTSRIAAAESRVTAQRLADARKRNQIWGASLILDELDELGMRIARAA